MASRLTRNQLPGDRLWVRIPCPPLDWFIWFTYFFPWCREAVTLIGIVLMTIRS